ncbi:hypothetical protein [Bacillus sp. AFS053548]|uniref:hypothetical protein n=1 Tax=Bacillus sp. AFS053548 TaxID=2033505 RepID=UPI000BFD8094|nr:hypothetical protein [Bacillus sp. AFS053548]PGM53817.1 hypothetical protein CN946_16485 [Bacillus sp. AFS053548]
MRYKHRFALNEGNKKIEFFLKSHEIFFDNSYGIVVFEVFEDNEHWEEIKQITDRYDIPSLVQPMSLIMLNG